jgi:signal transduction histidine kinase
LERALLHVALADPGLTLQSLRAARDDVLENGRYLEELIEALLTLARSQRGLDRKEAIDLAAVVSDVASSRSDAAIAAGLQLDLAFEATPILGDRALIERLVANLLDNAIHHNRAGGNVRMVTEGNMDGSRLIVANTGAVVPEEQLGRLFEPFQRISRSLPGEHEGLGLGLSIVQAIAKAHGARLAINAGASGGLIVEVRFPAGRFDGYAVGASSSETSSAAAGLHRVGP